MMDQFRRLWQTPTLRRDLLVVIGLLTLIRVIAHIPLPGIDATSLRTLLQGNQFLGLLNVFSGGTISNFSVIALGVGPYITGSIIIQLLTLVVPRLDEMQKEGEQGQAKLNAYMHYLTVPLCYLQGYGIIALLRQSAQTVQIDTSPFGLFTMLTIMAGSTMFLLWIGELMTQRKMGNGISLIIFAGIVAELPRYLAQAAATFDAGQIFTLLAYVAIGAVTIAGVVTMTEAQRNIPVTYAKASRGVGLSTGVQSYLPLRVNAAGVIPIIFAISLILFPQFLAKFFLSAKTAWIASLATHVIAFFQNQTAYGLIYFVLVIGFTFFYTSIIFQPEKIAENLQKQGGFLPGIRPGQPTIDHLWFIMNRVTFAGALFLGAIAVLPIAVQQLTGTQSLVVGGTSLLIVVSVVIETVKQVQGQLTMHEYDVA